MSLVGTRPMSNCAIVCQNEVVIEDWVKIGGDVSIYDTDFHSTNYIDRRCEVDYNIATKPVVIKQDSFIGAHSIILKGVTKANDLNTYKSDTDQ